MIQKERMVNEFVELVGIDSVSFQEREMADLLKRRMSDMGFEVYEDDAGEKIGGNAGNLICTLKGDSKLPCIMLSSHMDTVEPGIGKKAVIRDGYIYSDGTTVLGSDDIAGLVAILEAVRSVREEGFPHGDIQVVFTVAEEQGLLGANYLDFSKIHANFGFIFDLGGEIGSVAVRAPSEIDFKIRFFGKLAHAGIEPEKGISAIKIAAEAISGMQLGRICPETTANIGWIHGGGATNIVCEEVECTAEARSLDEGKLSRQVAHMRDCITGAAQKYGGRVEIEETQPYKAIDIKEDSAYFEILKKAARISGISPIPTHTGGASDANIFHARGIPSAALSIGMEKVHTKEERVSIENLLKTARLIEGIIRGVSL